MNSQECSGERDPPQPRWGWHVPPSPKGRRANRPLELNDIPISPTSHKTTKATQKGPKLLHRGQARPFLHKP